MCLTLSFWQVSAQMLDVNWLPLSDVMMAEPGHPVADEGLHAGVGIHGAKVMAFSHLLDPVMVKRYR